MNNKLFTLLAWLLLLIMAITWLTSGYTSLFLVILPVSIIFFSIGDDSYKDWKVNKNLSLKQVMMIGGAFLLAVAIVYFLLQLAGFLISDVLHLTGPAKVIIQFLAVVVCLYPIKFLFARVVVKVAK